MTADSPESTTNGAERNKQHWLVILQAQRTRWLLSCQVSHGTGRLQQAIHQYHVSLSSIRFSPVWTLFEVHLVARARVAKCVRAYIRMYSRIYKRVLAVAARIWATPTGSIILHVRKYDEYPTISALPSFSLSPSPSLCACACVAVSLGVDVRHGRTYLLDF